MISFNELVFWIGYSMYLSYLYFGYSSVKNAHPVGVLLRINYTCLLLLVVSYSLCTRLLAKFLMQSG